METRVLEPKERRFSVAVSWWYICIVAICCCGAWVGWRLWGEQFVAAAYQGHIGWFPDTAFHHAKGLRYYQDLGQRTADFVLLAVPIIAAIWYAIATGLIARPATATMDASKFLPLERSDWLVLAALTGASIAFGGIGVGVINHSVQIPAMFHKMDPSLFPRDDYVQMSDRYYSIFWNVLGWGSNFLGITASLVIAQVVTRAILLTGIFCLAASLFRNRGVAITAATLAVLGLSAVMVTPQLSHPVPTHTMFFLAVMPWLFLFVWQRKVIISAIILGVLYHINLMNAVLISFVVFVTILMNIRQYSRARLLAAGVIIAAAALPLMLWVVNTPSLDVSMSTYVSALRANFWYHFYPLMWGTELWLRLAGLVILTVICAVIGRAAPQPRMMLASLAAILVTWVLMFVVSLVPSLEPLVRMQFGRTAVLLVVLLLPSIAYLTVVYCPGSGRKGLAVFGVLAVGCWFAHGWQTTMILLAVGGASWLYIITTKHPQDRFGAGAIVACLVMLIAVPVIWGPGRLPQAQRNWLCWDQEPDWMAAQKWASSNTPGDALFLPAAWQEGFRNFSRRSVYFSEKDMEMMIWNPAATGMLLQRQSEMRELGLSWRSQKIHPEEMLSFCRVHTIDYVVLPASCLFPIAPVYVNNNWAIYRVP